MSRKVKKSALFIFIEQQIVYTEDMLIQIIFNSQFKEIVSRFWLR